MNLVKLDNAMGYTEVFVNPEAIAAILEMGSDQSIIWFQGSQQSITVPETASLIVEKLKTYSRIKDF
jgi:hypothetical protein